MYESRCNEGLKAQIEAQTESFKISQWLLRTTNILQNYAKTNPPTQLSAATSLSPSPPQCSTKADVEITDDRHRETRQRLLQGDLREQEDLRERERHQRTLPTSRSSPPKCSY